MNEFVDVVCGCITVQFGYLVHAFDQVDVMGCFFICFDEYLGYIRVHSSVEHLIDILLIIPQRVRQQFKNGTDVI